MRTTLLHLAWPVLVLSCGSASSGDTVHPPTHCASEHPEPIREMAIRDARAIGIATSAASTVLDDARARLDAMVAAAGGDASRPPSVAYAEIDALVALPNPFTAGAFSRLNYNLFEATTVDDLFQYYNDVQRLWQGFERMGLHTRPARRPELDRAATALGTNATASFGAILTTIEGAAAASASTGCPSAGSAMFGIVPTLAAGTVVAQLGFVEPVLGADGAPTGRMLARPTRTGAGREFAVFTGTEAIGAAPAYVILIDGAGSRGVLTSQASAFADFVRELQELSQLMLETTEIEHRLLPALDAIAASPPPEN